MKDEVVLVHSGESLLLHFARHLRLGSTSSDVETIKIAVQVCCASLFFFADDDKFIQYFSSTLNSNLKFKVKSKITI